MSDQYHESAKAYQTTDLITSVNDASPHELVNMLLEGAKKNIGIAKVCMENKKIELKTRHINKSLDIISYLQQCLNLEKGGELADNLDRLYDYMQYSLFESHANNDTAKLDDIYQLLDQIHQSWQLIKDQVEE